MHWSTHKWMGVFAATLCPFDSDEGVDESGLRTYVQSLCDVPGLKGLVPNGHTGEIMSLRESERSRVTSIVSDECQKAFDPGRTKAKKLVISGICGEGSLIAIDHAIAAKQSGADAILLMPPHHWLRFGRSSREAVGFVGDVADAADIDTVLHQYPAWTKASYSLPEMREIAKIPQVKAIKMGTRDMARWLWDYEQLKSVRPELSIITCHDEYILPTLLEAGDGALLGFAGFAPQLTVDLVHACLDGDLQRAKDFQKLVSGLTRLIYSFGEPGGSAHQRMKVSKWLLGEISSPVVRRPLRPLPDREIDQLREELKNLGLYPVR